MATNQGPERNSSHDEGSEGNSPPDEAPRPEGNSSQDEDLDYASEPLHPQGELMGDQGENVMMLSGREHPMPDSVLTPEKRIQCFESQCETYCGVIVKQYKEMETLREEAEKYLKRIETLTKQIEEKEETINVQEQTIKKLEELGDPDHELKELREDLERLEREHQVMAMQLTVSKNVARENDLLKSLLKEKKESCAKFQQLAKQLSDELKSKKHQLMTCNAMPGLHEPLYQGLLFHKQQDDANTWKIILVITRNNPFYYEAAFFEHGDPVIALTFNIVEPEVELSFRGSKSLSNWTVSPLPQLSKAVIDAYRNDGSAPLPNIEFSVQCVSQTCTPKFRCRFNLEGMDVGIMQPSKFFTVCLPPEL